MAEIDVLDPGGLRFTRGRLKQLGIPEARPWLGRQAS